MSTEPNSVPSNDRYARAASSLGFLVFAVAGLLGAAMISLVRRKAAFATAPAATPTTPVT
ncbi:hypothetical protein H5970_25000 [Amycolatopsis sp. CM201R]|uniref:hypothetical protein n=1 Tax=Amycolatopsis sp. 505 TaxID=2761538 RepID=UPI002876E581|nr:hypothetical protein [Amycolatopsis sp. 505]MDS0135778.1 hypothetical protein [Amycolatopsis sp. 505]MDS0145621.1 hypothetical protein [Amycolatopsis sp. CM201R]